jgi:hypothetical protein
MLPYFMTLWNILRPFGIISGYLLKFLVMWYIFPVLVCLDHEKSGNPGIFVKECDSKMFFSSRLKSTLLRPVHLRQLVAHLFLEQRGAYVTKSTYRSTPQTFVQSQCFINVKIQMILNRI